MEADTINCLRATIPTNVKTVVLITFRVQTDPKTSGGLSFMLREKGDPWKWMVLCTDEASLGKLPQPIEDALVKAYKYGGVCGAEKTKLMPSEESQIPQHQMRFALVNSRDVPDAFDFTMEEQEKFGSLKWDCSGSSTEMEFVVLHKARAVRWEGACAGPVANTPAPLVPKKVEAAEEFEEEDEDTQVEVSSVEGEDSDTDWEESKAKKKKKNQKKQKKLGKKARKSKAKSRK